MKKPSLPITEIPLAQGAADALARAGFSRRAFIKGSGALIVSFSMGGALGRLEAQQTRAGAFGENPAADSPPAGEVDSWIAIASDGSVTAYTGKEELGQGMSTAQMQLVAEELCVPFQRVKLIVADTSLTPDQGVTSGSQSHPANFNHNNLAGACATAREALLQLGSSHLSIPVDQLSAVDGEIRSKSDASKKVTYGELLAGKKFNLKLDTAAKRKPASEWTVLGKPIGRPDMAEMATGTFEFVHNVRAPGMLHGMVIRPSAVGANLMNVDESSVSAMPGFVKVVVKKNFVGVVAEKPWQAVQIARALNVTWSPAPELPKQETFYDHLRNQKPTRDTLLVNSMDVDQKLSEAATVVKATYNHPYQMHGSIGSSCAVADAGSLAPASHSRAPSRIKTREYTSDLSPRLGLLRNQRRRCGHVRRRASFPGRRQTGARPAHPKRRNGVGELRVRIYDRRARGPRRPGKYHRVGSRSVVAGARQSPGVLVSRKRHHRIPGGISARGIPAALARARAHNFQQQQQRDSFLCCRPRGRRRSWRGDHQVRTRAAAQCGIAVLDWAVALAAAPAKYFRARILHG
jgi:hypothetical protein